MYDNDYPNFLPGMDAISIVSHSPEIEPGTSLKIVKPWIGNLCVVQMPDGMIHRWFAWFELQPLNSGSCNPYTHGNTAVVIQNRGHGNPPHIQIGTRVKILRCIPTVFYDVRLNNGQYHRWLADFELALPLRTLK